ncbi:MAG: GNAT family N-acetyltransferase [Candidatus Promineifilaceae bacterium]
MNDDSLSFRQAVVEDLPYIIDMLADDPLGATRERFEVPLPDSYFTAFESISNNPMIELVVATLNNDWVIGVLQLTFIPNLSYQGGWRALIEGVRISADFRNKGIGQKMFEYAIGRAKEQGCHMIQLTMDKKRADAFRFYQSLGFQATHEGLKLHLEKIV